jgi:hypothetical protein
MYNMNTSTGRGFKGERSLHQSHLACHYAPPRLRALVITAFFFLSVSLITLVSVYFACFPSTVAATQLPVAPAQSSQQNPAPTPQIALHHKQRQKAGQHFPLSGTNTYVPQTVSGPFGSNQGRTASSNQRVSVSGFAFFLIVSIFLGWLTILLYRSWRQKLSRWRAYFICFRCEQLFIP